MKKLKEFFKKLKEFFSKITKSNILHLVAGVVVTLTMFGVISMCMHPSYRGVIASVLLVLITAVFKELYDKFCVLKAFKFIDVLCIILGAILASVLLLIIIL